MSVVIYTLLLIYKPAIIIMLAFLKCTINVSRNAESEDMKTGSVLKELK